MLSLERINEIKKIIKDNNLINKSLMQIAEENNIIIKNWKLDNLTDDNVSLSGAIFKAEENKYAIFINENDSEYRQRFTIAHELWHFFLHKDILDKVDTIIDRKESQYLYRNTDFEEINEETRWMEEEANEFAWNLLMPEEKFLELYKKYTIPQLSQIFSVSERAISTRFYYLSKRYDK